MIFLKYMAQLISHGFKYIIYLMKEGNKCILEQYSKICRSYAYIAMSSPTKRVIPGFLKYLQPEYKDQRDPSALLGEILVLLSQNLRLLFHFLKCDPRKK